MYQATEVSQIAISTLFDIVACTVVIHWLANSYMYM